MDDVSGAEPPRKLQEPKQPQSSRIPRSKCLPDSFGEEGTQQEQQQNTNHALPVAWRLPQGQQARQDFQNGQSLRQICESGGVRPMTGGRLRWKLPKAAQG